MSQTDRRPRESDESCQGGFTLIEVMIALLIFTFGILAIFRMQGTSISGNRSAQNISEAASIGTNRVEALITASYLDVSNGSQKKGKYDIDQDVTLNPDTTKSVTITVQWSEGNRIRRVIYDLIKPQD